MSISDFLFEGRSPSSVTTYGSTTQSMPRWLNEYAQGVLGRANAIGAAPYEPYGGPRLADLTPDQQRAMELTRGNVGAYLPYLQQANRTFTGQTVNDYMNPYTENVIDRAGTLAQRQLTEKFLPALSAKFGSRGSDARSSAYRRAADRGVRDVTEGLDQLAASQLAGSYEAGRGAFQNDASRFGNLAEQVQRLGLTDAAALETIGAQQQGETQKSLDLAYSDFGQQRDFDKNQLNWMMGILSNMPNQTNTTTSSTSPGDVPPSKAQQAIGLGTGIAGILQAIKGSRRGGYMRNKKLRRSPRTYYSGGTLGGY